MEPIRLEEVVKAVDGVPLESGLPITKDHRPQTTDHRRIKGVSIDSRTIIPGELFVAIKGSKYDGHSFIREAFDKGAAAAMIGADKLPITNYQLPIIVVKDTLKALGDLARYYRGLFSIPVVGITGSNGKTTTKELAARCLERKYRVLKSKDNFNSLTGVPLTLFNLAKTYELCVLEIGTNKVGEIECLSQIAKPEVGVITNIGPTHLESFKTVQGVLEEKLKLLDAVEFPIINADDPLLYSRLSVSGERLSQTENRKPSTGNRVFWYGVERGELRAEAVKYVGADPRVCPKTGDEHMGSPLRFKVRGVAFSLPLLGRYQVYNALAGIAVGLYFKLDLLEMSEALKKVPPSPHREELLEINGIKILDSSYNANPVSMSLAIEELKKYEGRKVAILGDMLELGEAAYNLHIVIGKQLKESGVDVLVAVGNLAKGYVEGTRADRRFYFESIDLLIKELENIIFPGDVVLVKGSRAMGMERIVDKFRLKTKDQRPQTTD